MSKPDRSFERMEELYKSSMALVRKYQAEREGLFQRVEAALIGINYVEDVEWQRKLASERLDRCRILWNGLRLLTEEYPEILHPQDKLGEIVTTILDGGPLGHQAELEDGIDVLNISDLERASGAIRYRERREQGK